MRFYDVAASSLAVGAPSKWTDNLLSQHRIDGVVSARQGVARRISRSALLRIAIIRRLSTEVGVSVASAVVLADALLGGAAPGVAVAPFFTLLLDRAGIERELDERLRDVLESAPTPRRGRPPKRPGHA